jgi:DNA-binding NarL/FixJ family response regulator
MLQLAGDWVASMDQAHRARAQLSTPRHQLALGAACYQLGDLHRLRGELTQAEDAYGLASMHGRDPQPGLALLRLTQRRTDAAATMSRRVVTEPCDRSTRVQILCGHVEIMIAVGDHGAARDAAGELGRLVADMPGPWMRATSSHAWGLVLLAEDEPAEALGTLRRAQAQWVAIDAPYQAARTRLLVAAACDALHDPDSATVERRAARAVFEDLGAVPDLRGLVEPTGHDQVLSGREIEVLRLVARGLTNKAIGARLVLSERTVERHLSNIFHKVDVPSRSAATAYAFEHGLV